MEKVIFKYNINIGFETMEQLQKFAKLANEWKQKIDICTDGANDGIVKKIDRRGCGTRQLHERTKRYLEEHNGVSYREAMKKVAKK